ncbi:MAG TPA: lipoprotein [Gammaproteobacteria bacterium]|nr:lipoprotein [Gammaproteobacteria bacterium]
MTHRPVGRALWPAGALLAAAVALAGCGQKGPLYLPAPSQAKPAPHKTDTEHKAVRKDNP